MTSIDHLLPEPDQVVRCAEHRRTLAIDPGGTAIRADRVILVSTPLPWPKPVFDHERLRDIAPILSGSVLPTRTLAFVPADGTGPAPESHRSSVVTFDRGTDGTVLERRFSAETPEALTDLAVALAENDPQALAGLADHEGPLTIPVALVCTQGSHDVCCGSEGARFAADAETIDDLIVYRVSHTGGHRFSPTAMTLPDGRMWAYLDAASATSIIERRDAADVAQQCRGWWGAPTGPAQVGERAVFAELGFDVDTLPRTVSVSDEASGASLVEVQVGSDTYEVVVARGREVPTIACEAPGGQPVKPGQEWVVTTGPALRS